MRYGRGDHLLSWLARSGARSARLRIAPDPVTGRAVVAAAPIAAGDVVVRIPGPLLLTAELARASLIGRAIAASAVDAPGDHTFLAAFLLQERAAPRSRFRPYLDALPASFPTVPLFFAPGALALLEGSCALDKIAARRAAIARDDAALGAAVPAFRRFSPDAFLWARTAVITRVFGIVKDGRKTEALVPLADMLNHRSPEETSWAYDDGAGAFVMTALRAFRAGDTVHDGYGRKSNARFFVNYGFTLDDNDDDDEASVRLALAPGVLLAAEKCRLLGTAHGEVRSFSLFARQDDPAPEALSFLRVACATRLELECLAAVRLDAGRVPPLNGRNETAALGLLAAACEAALARFPTSITEDDALLQNANLPLNARNAIVVRRGEKRVLARWIAIAREAPASLRLPLPALSRALAEGAGGIASSYLATFAAALGATRQRAAPAPPTEKQHDHGSPGRPARNPARIGRAPP